MNEFFSNVVRQSMESLKEVGISFLTHVFLTRRAHDSATQPAIQQSKYYDEGVLLSAYADLSDQLKSFDMPKDDVDRVIGQVADFFGNPANSTSREAENFRLSLAAIASKDDGKKEVWRQLNLFANADAAGKKALAAQLARSPAYVEWFEKAVIEAGQTWDRTIRNLLAQNQALSINVFIRTLGSIERWQFTLSLGRIENDRERLGLINEILSAPVDQRIDLAQARGLINISLARSVKDKIGKMYDQLDNFYTTWLDTPTGNAHAQNMRNQHVVALQNTITSSPTVRIARWIFS